MAENPPAKSGVDFIAPSATPSLTIDYAPRRLRMVTLSETELETIASPSASIHFGFFGVAFGAVVSLLITVSTVDIASPKMFAAFIAGTVLSGLATLYFGVRAILDYSANDKRVKRLTGN
jgi:hypothetical protein